jgi:hypothetical protein
LKGNDVVNGHAGTLFEGVVPFEKVPEYCDGWDAGDAGVHVSDVKGSEYLGVGDGILACFTILPLPVFRTKDTSQVILWLVATKLSIHLFSALRRRQNRLR